jgi:hypothetical protein
MLIPATLGVLFVTSPARAEVDFVKDIKPILEASCVKCHTGEKPKGNLRLDTKDGLLKGTKTGKVVVPGKADESLIYEVITLPKDDPLRMPNEGEPLAKAQTDLIRDWINEGLKWPEGVALKAAAAASTGTAAAKPMDDPGLPISDVEKDAVAKVQKSGVLALRLAQNSNWLRIDFSLRGKEVTDEDLALLKGMTNLVELNLGGTTVTDAGLAHVKGLSNLTRLQLHNSKITDAGLEHLKGLQKLTSLNLYGTAVTDQGLEHLKELKNLRKLYLWQTKVTEAGAKKLAEAIPGLEANLGFDASPPAQPKAETEKPKEPDKK